MFRSVSTLLLCLAVATPLVLAAPTAEQRAAMEERLDEVTARLALSDEQLSQVQPIISSSLERQRAVLERYGIDLESAGSGSGGRRNPREARQIKRELDAVRGDTRAQLEEVLSAVQLAEFDELQEERRLEMRERMRSGR